MAKRRVIWTQEASGERRGILQYWAKRNHSKVFSEKLFREFQQASRTLASQPHMGKEAEVEDVR
jgi:plasmid stabilization system protein ParE